MRKSSDVIKEDENFHNKIDIYFKYKIAALHTTLGYNNYFMEYMENRKDL